MYWQNIILPVESSQYQMLIQYFSSDSFSAKIMLSEIETKAEKFFADAGYDSNDLFEKLLNSKIIPVVKIKKHSGKIRKFRKVAEEMFDEEEYKKYRSVIEGVFGGLENRRLLFTRYRKKSMRMKHIIAMAIVHNINTYMAISLFILIYSTQQDFSKYLNYTNFLQICHWIRQKLMEASEQFYP